MKSSTRVKPHRPILDVAERALARRAHSRRELALKLGRHGYDQDAIEATLNRLAEVGYLDDAAYARSVVSRRSSGRGGAAIAAELRSRGVAREEVDTALAGLGGQEERAAAESLARRMVNAGAERAELQRAAGRLLRRGFSGEIAWWAVRRATTPSV